MKYIIHVVTQMTTSMENLAALKPLLDNYIISESMVYRTLVSASSAGTSEEGT
jgi:aspartate-semialdehyde dehydrogenase